jgi:hypothetical protein
MLEYVVTFILSSLGYIKWAWLWNLWLMIDRTSSIYLHVYLWLKDMASFFFLKFRNSFWTNSALYIGYRPKSVLSVKRKNYWRAVLSFHRRDSLRPLTCLKHCTFCFDNVPAQIDLWRQYKSWIKSFSENFKSLFLLFTHWTESGKWSRIYCIYSIFYSFICEMILSRQHVLIWWEEHFQRIMCISGYNMKYCIN